MTWLVQYRTTVSQLVAAGWRLDIKGPVVGLLLLDRRHETWPPLPAKGLTTRRRAGKPLPWFITRITQTGTNHRDKGLCVFVSVSQRWCCCCPHQLSTFLLLDHFWKVLLTLTYTVVENHANGTHMYILHLAMWLVLRELRTNHITRCKMDLCIFIIQAILKSFKKDYCRTDWLSGGEKRF